MMLEVVVVAVVTLTEMAEFVSMPFAAVDRGEQRVGGQLRIEVGRAADFAGDAAEDFGAGQIRREELLQVDVVLQAFFVAVVLDELSDVLERRNVGPRAGKQIAAVVVRVAAGDQRRERRIDRCDCRLRRLSDVRLLTAPIASPRTSLRLSDTELSAVSAALSTDRLPARFRSA